MDGQTARAILEELCTIKNAIRARDFDLALQLVKDNDAPFLWTPDGVWLGGEQSVELERQQKRILEPESKLGDADRTYLYWRLYWRGEALMLEKRLFELMENADRDRGEIERLNRMLLKALETLLLEE